MPTPQQPELARSGRSEATPEKSAKTRTGGPTTAEGPAGPVPEENLPGHHPEVEQDKPTVPPAARPRKAPARAKAAPKPKAPPQPEAAPAPVGAAGATMAVRRFPFAFEKRVMPFSMAFGVVPGRAWVEVGRGELVVRFGPWSLRTPLANVVRTQITGPFSLVRVAGPARLSLTDRGATFATSTERGVCICFRQPVSGGVPFGLVRHPAVTVTVEDAEGLIEALDEATA